ncbi:hypothetical protein D791_00800 [Nitrincola nitratireducens]|uniref:Uncharacterized protein n=1 Tax=Nitrincola nitratireducens TaxID=1229521 RepID=W9VQ36_9GAMM|nr:hypothetical protein D791_00800 [Nitrincola nitratireducens]
MSPIVFIVLHVLRLVRTFKTQSKFNYLMYNFCLYGLYLDHPLEYKYT